jgi:hypothetical protein
MSLENVIAVTLSQDKLQAYLEIQEWDDSMPLTVESLEELLSRHSVQYGIKHDQLSAIAANPEQYVLKKMLVAQGVAPVHGENGKIEYLFDTEPEEYSPMETEDGKVDFRQVRRLKNVLKGQKLAQRIPPTEGVPGMAVTGEKIEPKRGKEAFFKLGKNVVTDETKNFLYAAIDGLVTHTDGNKINVFPVYEVNGDVDYRVGNIDFVGNVVVRGNVLPGFRIRASGDIRIIGGVEAAELEAEGSIDITAGILGQNKGLLVKAGKNIRTNFIQDANVEAKEDIIVSLSILHSQVRAGKNVICQGGKGLIVGGVIQAGEKIIARTVGNAMSTPTVLEVGVQPELRNELNETRAKWREARDNLDKTGKALQILDQMAASGNIPPEKMAMRLRLSNTKKSLEQEIAGLQERMMEIEKSLEETGKSEIKVTSTVHAGTKVVIGRVVRFVKDPVRMVRFRMVDGDIAMESE